MGYYDFVDWLDDRKDTLFKRFNQWANPILYRFLAPADIRRLDALLQELEELFNMPYPNPNDIADKILRLVKNHGKDGYILEPLSICLHEFGKRFPHVFWFLAAKITQAAYELDENIQGFNEQIAISLLMKPDSRAVKNMALSQILDAVSDTAAEVDPKGWPDHQPRHQVSLT